MKRISLLVVTLLLAVVLVACGKEKDLVVKTAIENIELELTTIQFDIKLEDDEEQLEGDLIVYLYLGDNQVSKRDISLLEDAHLKGIKFTGLKEGTTYSVRINGTFLGKPVELHRRNIATQRSETKEISTVDEFLAMDNSYSKYVLVNDLDFEGVIRNQRISSFKVEFDGGGYSIKNYVLNNNLTNIGLFGTLTGHGKISNLTIDGMRIYQGTVETPQPVNSTRYVGFLVGRVNSNTAVIDNITIKNSQMNYTINTNSTVSTIRAGMLVGGLRGTVTNITIDDTNEINLNVNRFANIYLGGLVGEIEQMSAAVTINNIKANGTIDVKINQDGDAILTTKDSSGNIKNNTHNLMVGGLVGENRKDFYPENIIVGTNINYLEEQIYISDEPRYTHLTTRIGGIYGQSGYAVKNALYNGNINITQGNYLVKGEDPNITTFVHKIEVGGFAGNYTGNLLSFESVVRSNSAITATVIDLDRLVVIDNFFGKSTKTIDKDKFMLHGTIEDKINDVLNTNEYTFVSNVKDVLTSTWYQDNLN